MLVRESKTSLICFTPSHARSRIITSIPGLTPSTSFSQSATAGSTNIIADRAVLKRGAPLLLSRVGRLEVDKLFSVLSFEKLFNKVELATGFVYSKTG